MDPCHHGMTRPQVADGGTASNLEGKGKRPGVAQEVEVPRFHDNGIGRW